MSGYYNTKLAKKGAKGPLLSPQGVADFIEKLRYAQPAPGTSGSKTSRMEAFLKYMKPTLDAAHGVSSDYKALHKALEDAVPGSGKYLSKKMRRGAHHLGDYAGDKITEAVGAYGPGALHAARGGVDKLRDAVLGRPLTAWYHDPATAAGVGLGAAGLLGLGGYAAHQALNNQKDKELAEAPPEMSMPEIARAAEDTSLDKISSALELIADEIDAFGTAAFVEEKVASEEPANVFGQFYEFYKRQVGEEPPAALVEKLAQDADEETLSALEKLVKRAGMERPTPLGEPSEGGGYRAPPSSRDDAMKTAWEQFEETLLNYESA
jgi:hypothetical protein